MLEFLLIDQNFHERDFHVVIVLFQIRRLDLNFRQFLLFVVVNLSGFIEVQDACSKEYVEVSIPNQTAIASRTEP